MIQLTPKGLARWNFRFSPSEKFYGRHFYLKIQKKIWKNVPFIGNFSLKIHFSEAQLPCISSLLQQKQTDHHRPSRTSNLKCTSIYLDYPSQGVCVSPSRSYRNFPEDFSKENIFFRFSYKFPIHFFTSKVTFINFNTRLWRYNLIFPSGIIILGSASASVTMICKKRKQAGWQRRIFYPPRSSSGRVIKEFVCDVAKGTAKKYQLLIFWRLWSEAWSSKLTPRSFVE